MLIIIHWIRCHFLVGRSHWEVNLQEMSAKLTNLYIAQYTQVLTSIFFILYFTTPWG